MDLEIAKIIATGSFTVGGALVGALFGHLNARRQDIFRAQESEIRKLRKNYVSACQQISAYYQLESAYCKDLASLASQSEQQTKIKYRDIVEKAGYERPSWTSKDANDAIKSSE
jgi:hypothetical protein